MSSHNVDGPPSRSSSRVAPERNAKFEHLTIDGLRIYRTALAEEENRVSYWRRIIQARLDVVRAGESGSLRVDNLRNVLAEARIDSARRSLITVVPIEDIPPLPDLAQLWDREPVADDIAHNETLARDLAGAEIQLSAYRSALHRRISSATDELIARYREDPQLCLAALPVDKRAAARR
jgi:hypothetical protein